MGFKSMMDGLNLKTWTASVFAAFLFGTVSAQAQDFAFWAKSNLSGSGFARFGNFTIEKKWSRGVYETNGYQPLFLDESLNWRNQVQEVRSVLTSAHFKGLNANEYWNSYFDELISQPGLEAKFSAEVLLTHALTLYLRDLNVGRLPQSAMTSQTQFKKKEFVRFSEIPGLIVSNVPLPQAVMAFEPQSEDYQRLLNELRRILEIGKSQWLTVASSGVLRPGQSHASDVLSLRQKLTQLGYSVPSQGSAYDNPLQSVVMDFQRNSLLAADAVVGPQTRRRLNISFDNYVNLLRISLEKWRWLPTNLYFPNLSRPTQKHDRFVFVNVAHQNLKLFEFGQRVMQMPVIAGKPEHKTPQRIDFMATITINPFWTVPRGVLERTILPAAAENPNYFTLNRFRITDSSGREINPSSVNWKNPDRNQVFSWTYRQFPGPNNALGFFRFDLATGDEYYLHHTSASNLPIFATPDRLASSGCVRLSDPTAVAEYAFQVIGSKETKLSTSEPFRGDRDQILSIIANPEAYPSQRIPLARSFYVYLTYFTVEFDDQGRPKVASDAYGQDQALLTELNRPAGVLPR
ncbi:MAG: L,D-transpeptidase family protein [Pseudobdellovibrionaceae bacterium]